MRDIEEFREYLAKIIDTEKKRFNDPINAKKVLEFDEKWRTVLQELEVLRSKRNKISASISDLKKAGNDVAAENAIIESKQIKKMMYNFVKQWKIS